jgi:hypothetical protein
VLGFVEAEDDTPVTMAMLKEGKLSEPLYVELRMSFIQAKALSESQNVLEQILAEEITDTQAALAGNGFVLHTDKRQALLDQIAPALHWSPELLEALKRIGRPLVPCWQLVGFSEEPTLEVVEARQTQELLAIAAANRYRDIVLLRQKWDDTSRAVRAAIDAGQLGSDQVPSKVSELWQR